MTVTSADPGPLPGGRVRLLIAPLAGALTGLSWQPSAWWPLLFLGLPLLTLAVRGVRLRRAFLLGYLYGFAMLAVTISWLHVLGWWVAALLVAFEGLIFGLLAVALRVVAALPWWPLAAALCWSLVEFGYSRAPFGGFGWTRIAYAAVDTPLAGFFPIVGVAGVSFLVALIAQMLAWLAVRRTVRTAAAALAGIVLLGGTGTALLSYEPEPADGTAGSISAGVVQGNVPGKGIEALGRARSVTNNHLTETIDLMARARLGATARPDFLLWPENSTDIDPLRDPVTFSVVASSARLAGLPILVGAVTEGPGPDERQTTAMWWDPQRGITAVYHKRNLVPFGEWIPFRSQLLPLVPILKEVGAQSVPGTDPGVLDVMAGGRPVRVGDVICFELAYDRTVYDTVRHGAQILVVQSNNATYGGTGQIEQQFAITRARAMETRREIAVATTNSVSGFIDRTGQVLHRTEEFTADSFVVSMPLRSAVTPAVLLAPWVDRVAAMGGLVAVIFGATRRLRRRGSGTLEPVDVVPPRERARTGAIA